MNFAAIDPTFGVIASASISAILSVTGLLFGRYTEHARISLKADASKVDVAFESLQGEVQRCQGECAELRADNRTLRIQVGQLMGMMQAAGIEVPDKGTV